MQVLDAQVLVVLGQDASDGAVVVTCAARAQPEVVEGIAMVADALRVVRIGPVVLEGRDGRGDGVSKRGHYRDGVARRDSDHIREVLWHRLEGQLRRADGDGHFVRGHRRTSALEAEGQGRCRGDGRGDEGGTAVCCPNQVNLGSCNLGELAERGRACRVKSGDDTLEGDEVTCRRCGVLSGIHRDRSTCATAIVIGAGGEEARAQECHCTGAQSAKQSGPAGVPDLHDLVERQITRPVRVDIAVGVKRISLDHWRLPKLLPPHHDLAS